LGIVPSKNLVSNIGFGIDSTHYKNILSRHDCYVRFDELEFPLVHPVFMVREIDYDKALFRRLRYPEIKISYNFFSILYEEISKNLTSLITK